jgi:hypothetical protein
MVIRAGHAVRVENMTNANNFLSGNIKGRDHSEDLGVDGSILQRILGKHSEKLWLGCI